MREYAKQLLLALGLLAKLHIVHADIKPHNILANERLVARGTTTTMFTELERGDGGERCCCAVQL